MHNTQIRPREVSNPQLRGNKLTPPPPGQRSTVVKLRMKMVQKETVINKKQRGTSRATGYGSSKKIMPNQSLDRVEFGPTNINQNWPTWK